MPFLEPPVDQKETSVGVLEVNGGGQVVHDGTKPLFACPEDLGHPVDLAGDQPGGDRGQQSAYDHGDDPEDGDGHEFGFGIEIDGRT